MHSIGSEWKPFATSGFTVGLGYVLVTLGGGATTEEFLEGVTGVELDQRASQLADQAFSSDATLHLATLCVGWEFDLGRQFILRTSLGWAFTFLNSASVQAEFTADRPAGQQAIEAFELVGETYLTEKIRDYVHPPHVGLALGRLF